MQLTLKALEAYLSKQYCGRCSDQSLFMKLVEEIGETAEILNMRDGRKSADGSDLDAELGKELADIIHYAVAIAAVNNLDLSDIIIEKDKKASVKYHREENFEDFLREYELRSAIERIRRMEQLFDEVQEAFFENPLSVTENENVKKKLDLLTDYYENGLWLSDYKLDESGKIPADLKRGILSEDGFYNFLSEIDELKCKNGD